MLRNSIGGAHTNDAEIVFEKVREIDSVAPHKYLGGLQQLIRRVAREDPARAVTLLASQPAGTFRGELVAAALETAEQGESDDLQRLVRENPGFFRASEEAKIVNKALEEADARQR